MKPEIRLKTKVVYNCLTKRRSTWHKYETVKRGIVCILPQVNIAMSRGMELEEAYCTTLKACTENGYICDVGFGMVSLEVAGAMFPANEKHLHKPENQTYVYKFHNYPNNNDKD